MMADCSGSASSSQNTLTMSTAHRMRRAGSVGLVGYHTDCSDDDLESSSHSHAHERSKSDRMPVTKPEEDRRRRTIIVEKKINSYGFTLQSYGIHYKKEQEIEMITYVDYVEYDGPAYRAGMREGDVILSINGADMEKADHKTLVSFIKGCDTRMRMVVLFEDCVRKVELHMRYIQLQTVLQGKMNELERTCLRERELLEGKWKTHSLPARKKATTSNAGNNGCTDAGGAAVGATEAQSPTDNNGSAANGGADCDTDVPVVSPFCRPALSTEDVHHLGRNHFRHLHHHNQQQQPPPPPLAAQQHQEHHQFYKLHHQQHLHLQSLGAVIPPPAQFMLTYQYLDPHCRYVLRPSLLLSSSAGNHHHHHHSSHHQQHMSSTEQQQQQQHNYYASRKSPEDIPVTNFGSNESTNEIVTETQHSAIQPDSQRHNHHHHHHHHSSAATEANGKVEQQAAATANSHGRTSSKSTAGRHCHGGGHSCNPCVGHRKDKSSASATAANGADNVSLDAYDLASPCCDPHCVPTRRRSRHHKDHHHRHKHRDKDQKDHQQRPQRPRSQSHAASPSMLHTTTTAAGATASSSSYQHGLYNEKCQNHRPRFYDITAGLATHCSLHSCMSAEYAADPQQELQPISASGGVGASATVQCAHGESSAASYTTSLSTDTLYWDPESQQSGTAVNSRQLSTKSRQSTSALAYQPIGGAVAQTQQIVSHQQQQQQQQHQQQRFHAHAGTLPYDASGSSGGGCIAAGAKPKSWDNLAMKGIGGYGFGYSYQLAGKPPPPLPPSTTSSATSVTAQLLPSNVLFAQQAPTPAQHLHQQQQQRHSIPRKNPYGRYSTFSDVENYAPPPSQFVQHSSSTITTTTITKSTENLIGGSSGALHRSDSSGLHTCDGCNDAGSNSASGGGGAVAYVAQMQSMSPAAVAAASAAAAGPKHHDCRGYYSHLPRARLGASAAVANHATTNAATNESGAERSGAPGGGGNNVGSGSVPRSAAGGASNRRNVSGGTGSAHVATVSEVTRL